MENSEKAEKDRTSYSVAIKVSETAISFLTNDDDELSYEQVNAELPQYIAPYNVKNENDRVYLFYKPLFQALQRANGHND